MLQKRVVGGTEGLTLKSRPYIPPYTPVYPIEPPYYPYKSPTTTQKGPPPCWETTWIGSSTWPWENILEGHGDLVSRLAIRTTRVTIWAIGVINLFTKSP